MVLPCLARSTLSQSGERGAGVRQGRPFLETGGRNWGDETASEFCAHLHIPSVHWQEAASFPGSLRQVEADGVLRHGSQSEGIASTGPPQGERQAERCKCPKLSCSKGSACSHQGEEEGLGVRDRVFCGKPETTLKHLGSRPEK